MGNLYNEHDFGEEGGVDKAVAYAKMGPIHIPIPNTAARKEVIWLHDLHHLLNGYDTTWPGEGQVSAWELAAGGFSSKLYIWLPVLLAMSVGILFYPVLTFRAFVRGTYCRSIMGSGISKNGIILLSVRQLKEKISLNPNKEYAPKLSHCVRFGLLWLGYAGGVSGLILMGFWFVRATG